MGCEELKSPLNPPMGDFMAVKFNNKCIKNTERLFAQAGSLSSCQFQVHSLKQTAKDSDSNAGIR
jgi:hypothetical protein